MVGEDIYHMFVKEPFRKQKVGTKLLEECLAALKKEGIHKDYRNLELTELVRIDT